MAAGLVFLYLNLFMFPAVPTTPQVDAANHMTSAVRMLRGEVMYRDFFQLTPPGTEVVYYSLFSIFGVRAWIGSALSVLLGVTLAWLSLVVSRRVLEGWSVFLPGVLFLTFIFRSAPFPKHSWFSMLPVTAALAVLVRRRTLGRLAGAGVLCGVGTCFTQVSGLAAALAIASFLLWDGWRTGQSRRIILLQQAVVAAPFLGTVIAANAMFAWRAGLERFLFCTVVFGSKYYRADFRWNSLASYFSVLEMPRFEPLWRLPALGVYLFPHILLPLVYCLFLAAFWRRRNPPDEPWRGLMLINFFGIFLFLSIATSPLWGRLCVVSMPGLILLVWLATTWKKVGRVVLRLLWASGLLLAVGTVGYTQMRWRAYLETSVGRMAILTPFSFEECQWVLRRIKLGETIYGGQDRIMYFILGLPNPSPVPFITGTDYTRPEQVQDVVEALSTKPVRFVFWQVDLDASGVPSSQNHLGPLRDYLRKHFHAVKTFGEFDEVWERNP